MKSIEARIAKLEQTATRIESRTMTMLDVAKWLSFRAELEAREIETQRPDLAPVNRRWLVDEYFSEVNSATKH